MPQMSPMNWFLICIFFFIFMNIMLPLNNFSSTHFKEKKIQMKTLSWKW
nr:ATP synthase F0 subunit 8 [Hygrobates turcicus]UYS90923.1 ATP synthase F0 subunit 8 [Hygrobates turcicus]